jgi:hypothetical protein
MRDMLYNEVALAKVEIHSEKNLRFSQQLKGIMGKADPLTQPSLESAKNRSLFMVNLFTS